MSNLIVGALILLYFCNAVSKFKPNERSKHRTKVFGECKVAQISISLERIGLAHWLVFCLASSSATYTQFHQSRGELPRLRFVSLVPSFLLTRSVRVLSCYVWRQVTSIDSRKEEVAVSNNWQNLTKVRDDSNSTAHDTSTFVFFQENKRILQYLEFPRLIYVV